MAHYNSFQGMDIFKLAREISDDVWQLILNTPLGKDYKLRDQINGSSGSVMDNIAEGFGRGGNKEFINFLGFSRGSCMETESQLLRALDRNHITKVEFDELYIKTKSCSEQILKFINYLRSSEKKGSKFD